MAVQAYSNYDLFVKISGGVPYGKDSQTIAQIVGRAIDLERFTLMYMNPSTRKWGPLRTVDPTLTSGYMTCGALGATEAELAALTDGEFSIDIDGVTIDITGLNATMMDIPSDTRAKMVCGANGGVIGAYTALSDASFRATINGTQRDIGPVDLTGATTFNDILSEFNVILLPFNAYMEYDETADVFTLYSLIVGDQSTLTVLSAAASGTDISGASYLNGATGVGTVTQGTGGSGFGVVFADLINAKALGRFHCVYNGTAFVFTSPISGPGSTVSVLSAVSGGSGTDISGASYLNGLTGTGTAVAGTGGQGEDLPMGIYMGQDIAAADIAAGDVTGVPILTGGYGVRIWSDILVIENSLTLNSVVQRKQKTIEYCLAELGVYPEAGYAYTNYEG